MTAWIFGKNMGKIEEEAAVLRDLIFPYLSVKDPESSQACSEKCLELARQTNNLELMNHCLGYVCLNLFTAKKYSQAKPMIMEYLDTSQKLKQPDGIVLARHYLADCALADKDFKEAENLYKLSMETGREYGNYIQSVIDIQGVAFAVSGQSRWEKAIRLDAAANEIVGKEGVKTRGLVDFWDEWIDTYIERAKKEVGEKAVKQLVKEGVDMGYDEAARVCIELR